MESFDFALTINLKLTLQQGQIALSVNNVSLNPGLVSLPMPDVKREPEPIEKHQTYHGIILEVAKDFVDRTGRKVFTAADLYNLAREKYPHLKRSTFNNRVMAAAPEHSSYKHLMGTKDFLKFLGNGKYELKKY